MAVRSKPPGTVLNRGNALAKDLVYALPFNEGAGTKLVDVASHMDATTTNSPAWDRYLMGAGLEFNGSSQYATIPDNDLLDSLKRITISIWMVKVATTTAYSMYVSRATDLAGATDLWLLYNGDAGLNDCYSFAINTGSPSYLNSSTSSDSDLNTLVNITGSYDGVNMKLYKNGIEIATTGKTGDLIAGSAPIRIAAGDNSPTVVSEFAPIQVYSLVISRRGWTPTEVRSYYNNPWQIYKQPNTSYLTPATGLVATTLRASSSNSASTGTAVSVSAPTGTIAGDVVVITLHGNGQTTFVDNNGATPFTASSVSDYKPNTSGGHTVSIYTRTIEAGDPSTYNFTMGTSGRWSIIADTYKSPNTTSFFDVAPNTSNAANADNSDAATIDAPSITTLTANAIHVVHGYFDDGSAGNPSGPAGYTAAGADNDEPQGAFYKVIAAAGATGAQTVTGTSVAPRIALSYAIRDINSSVASSTYVNSFYGGGGYF